MKGGKEGGKEREGRKESERGSKEEERGGMEEGREEKLRRGGKNWRS